MNKILLIFAMIYSGLSFTVSAYVQLNDSGAPDLIMLSFTKKATLEKNYTSSGWDMDGSPHYHSLPPVSRTKYEVKVKNNGQKVIKTVWWRYVQAYPTGESYRDYCSQLKIKPGQIKKLEMGQVFGKGVAQIVPTFTEAERQKHLGEQAVIMCIQYKDGSIWNRP